MFPKFNIQYFLSYCGLFPFLYIILDKYFLFLINEEIFKQIILNYILIITAFIGAINWKLEEKINNFRVIYGFIPSLFALIIITLNEFNFSFYNLITTTLFFLFSQLISDYFIIYAKNSNKKPFIELRLPLTLLIVASSILIIT